MTLTIDDAYNNGSDPGAWLDAMRFLPSQTPAPHFLASDRASGSHQGCAAEVANDGGTPGIITRRECTAMAHSSGSALSGPQREPHLVNSGGSLNRVDCSFHGGQYAD